MGDAITHSADVAPTSAGGNQQQMRLTPRGAHLLAQVRCAVLNGDAAEKLRAFEAANAYRVDPEVEQFLERLQRAA